MLGLCWQHLHLPLQWHGFDCFLSKASYSSIRRSIMAKSSGPIGPSAKLPAQSTGLAGSCCRGAGSGPSAGGGPFPRKRTRPTACCRRTASVLARSAAARAAALAWERLFGQRLPVLGLSLSAAFGCALPNAKVPPQLGTLGRLSSGPLEVNHPAISLERQTRGNADKQRFPEASNHSL